MLDEYERQKLDEIGEAVARIDERTRNLTDSCTDKMRAAHHRIDEVRKEAKTEARKTGAIVGGVISALFAAAWGTLRSMFT